MAESVRGAISLNTYCYFDMLSLKSVNSMLLVLNLVSVLLNLKDLKSQNCSMLLDLIKHE